MPLRRPWTYNPETKQYEVTPKTRRYRTAKVKKQVEQSLAREKAEVALTKKGQPRRGKYLDPAKKPRKTSLAKSMLAKCSPDDPRAQGDSYDTCLRQCVKLQEYWRARGFEVKAEPEEIPGSFERYRMKTDLVAGSPRGYRPPNEERVVRSGSGATARFSYRDLVRDSLK